MKVTQQLITEQAIIRSSIRQPFFYRMNNRGIDLWLHCLTVHVALILYILRSNRSFLIGRRKFWESEPNT